MEGTLSLRSNRQFYALFAAWAVFAALLPSGAGGWMNVMSLTASRTFVTDPVLWYALSWTQTVSLALGTGLFVYTVARAGWRRMWLFPVTNLVLAVLTNLAFYPLLDRTVSRPDRVGVAGLVDSSQVVPYLAQSLLLTLATMCIEIALVRLCATRLKKEWQIVLASFVLLTVFLFVGSMLETVAENIGGLNTLTLLRKLWGYTRTNLMGAAGYLVVAFLLTEHKREKLGSLFGRTGAAAKKLWDATAK